MSEEMTTITISKSSHKRLSDIGNYGESMNDIIVRLLDCFEKSEGKKK